MSEQPTTAEEREARLKLLADNERDGGNFHKGVAPFERRLIADIARLEHRLSETQTPIESYACQKCGRRDGLDAGVTNEVWAQLTGHDDCHGLLCLWCMDKLATEKGITAFVMLHFAGRALVGADGPTIWDEDEATEKLLDAETRCVRAIANTTRLEQKCEALEQTLENNVDGVWTDYEAVRYENIWLLADAAYAEREHAETLRLYSIAVDKALKTVRALSDFLGGYDDFIYLTGKGHDLEEGDHPLYQERKDSRVDEAAEEARRLLGLADSQLGQARAPKEPQNATPR